MSGPFAPQPADGTGPDSRRPGRMPSGISGGIVCGTAARAAADAAAGGHVATVRSRRSSTRRRAASAEVLSRPAGSVRSRTTPTGRLPGCSHAPCSSPARRPRANGPCRADARSGRLPDRIRARAWTRRGPTAVSPQGPAAVPAWGPGLTRRPYRSRPARGAVSSTGVPQPASAAGVPQYVSRDPSGAVRPARTSVSTISSTLGSQGESEPGSTAGGRTHRGSTASPPRPGSKSGGRAT